MKYVLSYALFRAPQPVYWRSDRTEDRVSAYARYLPVLIRAHHAIWPGYELRIHHDDAARAHPYFEALTRLEAMGLLRLVSCGPASALTLAMFWRMRPLFDDDVALVLTCDIDALPILRLRRCVEAFAATGKAAMLVHGCESHNGVLGGAFGARPAAFRQMLGCSSWDALVARSPMDWQIYGSDEEFLRQILWPRLADAAIIYRGGGPLNLRCPDVRPYPDTPPPDNLLPEVAQQGDWYAPYIGSAGYELIRAFDFYQGLPLPVMQTIRACEGEGLDLNRVMQP